MEGALSPLRNLLDRAVDENLIPRNPVRQLEGRHMPASDEHAKRVLAPAETAKLVEQATDRFKLVVKVLAATGMRVSECLGMIWGDLNVDAGTIDLTWQLGEDGDRVPLKTDAAERVVYLPEGLVRQLAARKLAALQSGDRDYVWGDETGRPMTRPALESGSKEAAKRAGLRDDPELPNATPHALRHTYASMLIAQGKDVVTISKALGHASADITPRVYAREFATRDEAERRKQLAAGVGDELAAALAA